MTGHFASWQKFSQKMIISGAWARVASLFKFNVSLGTENLFPCLHNLITKITCLIQVTDPVWEPYTTRDKCYINHDVAQTIMVLLQSIYGWVFKSMVATNLVFFSNSCTTCIRMLQLVVTVCIWVVPVFEWSHLGGRSK